jgi:uncharacterized protein
MFMSCREDQDFAEAVIDSLKFAADGDCVAGRLAVSRLARLDDVLVSRDGWLDCRLAGFRERDESGVERFGLHLQVSGRLGLRCQRCLGEVGFECAIDSRLLLMPPGVPSSEWPEDELEADDYDAIPANREMALLELVEEEVLLALPVVPRHAECRFPADVGAEEEESESSPFAALAGLKKH